MESFVTQSDFELKSERGVREIYIPSGIKVVVKHVSGDWWKLIANCYLTSQGSNEVMLGITQINKLKGH